MPVQRGLAQECQQHFQTSNIYEIFSLTKSATDVQSIDCAVCFVLFCLSSRICLS